MKYRKYFRKTSLKQNGHGETFLKEVLNKKPKSFLEIGVFHGVTARNVCELLYKIHGNDFKYVGLDLFEKSDENKFEVIPSTNFKNPFKKFYHQYIMRQDPYSIEGVSNLLKKFKNQVHLIKGNSNQVLKKMDMSKIDFVFLDGGHQYNTVVNDLNSCMDVLKFNGSILCDDYNLGSAPGVKKAIDEFVKTNNFKCEIICDDRFALIEN
ncbi:class I SAM-dependent methyltransferase [Candidatus Pelagibacter sp.]|nr:class I SAM-dependent methyltransferase [Candidatus Pelagibacter sp.]MDC0997256.1 class I SAM-dependent methyltransferase [Candidatus Pelagibacter sp.]